jgi:hypothetical protein
VYPLDSAEEAAFDRLAGSIVQDRKEAVPA